MIAAEQLIDSLLSDEIVADVDTPVDVFIKEK
jgi:hypothetical protein